MNGMVNPAVSDETLDDRRGKSDSAYRTISEVAVDLNLPQHVLRFWESKFKQISPLKRGGGRRYYRPQDIDLIKRIHHLLHTQGYTIKGVQKLLVKDRNLATSVTKDDVPVTAQPVQQQLLTPIAKDTIDRIQSNTSQKELNGSLKTSDLQIVLQRLKVLSTQINERC
jgi:DNA-binding transcriptional MerR regulator